MQPRGTNHFRDAVQGAFDKSQRQHGFGHSSTPNLRFGGFGDLPKKESAANTALSQEMKPSTSRIASSIFDWGLDPKPSTSMKVDEQDPFKEPPLFVPSQLPEGNAGWYNKRRDQQFQETIVEREDLEYWFGDDASREQARYLCDKRDAWLTTQNYQREMIAGQSIDELRKTSLIPGCMIKELFRCGHHAKILIPEPFAGFSLEETSDTRDSTARGSPFVFELDELLIGGAQEEAEFFSTHLRIPVSSMMRKLLGEPFHSENNSYKSCLKLNDWAFFMGTSADSDPNNQAYIFLPDRYNYGREEMLVRETILGEAGRLLDTKWEEFELADLNIRIRIQAGMVGSPVFESDLRERSAVLDRQFALNSTQICEIHDLTPAESRYFKNVYKIDPSKYARALFSDTNERDEFMANNGRLAYVYPEAGLRPGVVQEMPKPSVHLVLRWNNEPSSEAARIRLKNPSDVQFAINVLNDRGINALPVLEQDFSRQFRCVDIKFNNNSIEAHWESLLKEIIEKVFGENDIPYEDVELYRQQPFYGRQLIPGETEQHRILKKVHQRIARAAMHTGCYHERFEERPGTEEQWSRFVDEPTRHRWRVKIKDPSLTARENFAKVDFDDLDYGLRCTEYLLGISPNPQTLSMHKNDRHGVIFLPSYKMPLPVPHDIIYACMADLKEYDEMVRRRSNEATRRQWLRLNISDQQPDCIILEGYPVEYVHEQVERVKDLLKGETLDCKNAEKEGRLLYGHGLQWVKMVRIEQRAKTVIILDKLNCSIDLIGTKQNIDKTRQRLLKFIEQPHAFKMTGKIQLSEPRFIRSLGEILMKIEYEQKHYLRKIVGGGDYSIRRFEDTYQINVHSCTLAQYDRLNEFLETYNQALITQLYPVAKFESRLTCPICFCPVRGAYQLSICGHTFCLDCLAAQIRSQSVERQVPMKCLVSDCSANFAWQNIKDLIVDPHANLPIWFFTKRIEPLVRCSLNYAVKHSDDLRLCMYPDCDGVNPVSNVECIKQCIKCSRNYCMPCGFEPHPNQTCLEYRVMRDSADISVNTFMENKPDIQRCPNEKCRTVIQKIDGCNHMRCKVCSKHFCWICRYESDQEGEVYKHLRETHGNIGGGWDIVGNRVVAAPAGDEDALIDDGAIARQLQQAELDQLRQLEMQIPDGIPEALLELLNNGDAIF